MADNIYPGIPLPETVYNPQAPQKAFATGLAKGLESYIQRRQKETENRKIFDQASEKARNKMIGEFSQLAMKMGWKPSPEALREVTGSIDQPAQIPGGGFPGITAQKQAGMIDIVPQTEEEANLWNKYAKGLGGQSFEMNKKVSMDKVTARSIRNAMTRGTLATDPTVKNIRAKITTLSTEALRLQANKKRSGGENKRLSEIPMLIDYYGKQISDILVSSGVPEPEAVLEAEGWVNKTIRKLSFGQIEPERKVVGYQEKGGTKSKDTPKQTFKEGQTKWKDGIKYKYMGNDQWQRATPKKVR